MVHDVVREPGQPLDVKTRSLMEARFGRDLSRVRVHSNTGAAMSAATIGARAYTIGSHVAFGAGEYKPSTATGRGLLAHELAHTIQPMSSPISNPRLQVGSAHSAVEREADELATAAARGDLVPCGRSTRSSREIYRATRTFSLTFDDGPHTAPLGKGTNRTEKVLDALQNRGIKAGFFIQTGVTYRGANPVGPALVARMAADGHSVGIHTGGTADHELHTSAEKKGRLASELTSAASYISTHTGSAPVFVRPPTGKSNPAVRATYKKLGLTNLLWDIDGDEGKSLPVPQLKARIDTQIAKVHKRGWTPSTASPNIVVLYHDIQKNTADNLDALITHIEKTTSTVTAGADTAAFAAP
jgi:peptidoglycan/xylan/chitin deacetylase (PgdA/CDA1 family)